jgi:DNA-binding transcriptional regulator YbjK
MGPGKPPRRRAPHFSKIELVDIPNKGVVYLHSDAKARIEAVQAEIGADAMPRNNGVAWSFRSLFDFSGAQNHANMHTLGLAVDYNAYANPMLTDSRLINLIRTVTGRSHHLELGEYSARRKLIKQMGDTTAGGDEDAKKKLDASKPVTDFFTTLETEVNALATASTTFKGSLGASATKFSELKVKYLDAIKLKDKTAKADAIAAVAKDLPATLKPWFDAIETREKDAQTQATALGATNLATLGEKADLQSKLKGITDALARRSAR